MLKRGLFLIANLLLLAGLGCDFNLNAPEEIRTIHVVCFASGDTITVNLPEGQTDDVYCGETPDSVVIVTP